MRQVLVVSGKDNFDPIYNKPAMDDTVLLEMLSTRKDIKLFAVGNGSENISNSDIEQVLTKIDKSKPLTIVMQCHGTMKNGAFEFILGENSKISSQELFNLISKCRGNNSIDLFTPACYGGGMMNDAEALPRGSILVSLISSTMENNGSNYCEMVSNIDKFKEDFTAYNLLQFYMLNYLKNRFEPHIAVSGGEKININDLLVDFFNSAHRPQMKSDKEIVALANNPEKVYEVVDKLNNAKNKWAIYAAEYGTALSVMLDRVEKEHQLFNTKPSSQMGEF